MGESRPPDVEKFFPLMVGAPRNPIGFADGLTGPQRGSSGFGVSTPFDSRVDFKNHFDKRWVVIAHHNTWRASSGMYVFNRTGQLSYQWQTPSNSTLQLACDNTEQLL